MTAPVGLEYTGLRETATALKKAGVSDDAVKDAMNAAGGIVVKETWRIMPVQSGKMARTLKANRSKSTLTVKVGSKAVPYAYSFHAKELGKSKGGFTFRVPAHRRQGGQVSAYKRQGWLPYKGTRPFLFTAWERKKADVYRAYVTAVADLFAGVSRG